MDSKEKAIIKTLLYADIFDYPLTKTEVFKFLIAEKVIGRNELSAVLKNQKLPIEESENYFYLTGRKGIVEKRKRREKISAQKLKKAKEIIKKITFIPTLKLIGISGALSMGNSDEDDDIDLFVITENNLAWTTRALLVILLTLLGVYRNRKSKNHSNKICLNMILDENHSGFSKQNRDLYTSHEIVQLLPIFSKEETYEKFIGNNSWVKNFLPNFTISENILSRKNSVFGQLIIQILRLLQLEKIAKFFQLSYMKEHKTREITADGFLKFHPYDYKRYVLKEYKIKSLRYGV